MARGREIITLVPTSIALLRSLKDIGAIRQHAS
jgi:hypothetical protein